jgi:hypothetical protein
MITVLLLQGRRGSMCSTPSIFKHCLTCFLDLDMPIYSYVLVHQAIPDASRPIFSSAMKDIVVCCTGITKEERDDLHNKVEMMVGQEK